MNTNKDENKEAAALNIQVGIWKKAAAHWQVKYETLHAASVRALHALEMVNAGMERKHPGNKEWDCLTNLRDVIGDYTFAPPKVHAMRKTKEARK